MEATLTHDRSASEPNDVDIPRKSPEPWFRTFPGRFSAADVSRSTSPPPWFIAEPHTPVARDFEVFENVRPLLVLVFVRVIGNLDPSSQSSFLIFGKKKLGRDKSTGVRNFYMYILVCNYVYLFC